MTLTQVIVQLLITAVTVVVGVLAFLLDTGDAKEWVAFAFGVLFLFAALCMLWGTFLQIKQEGLK